MRAGYMVRCPQCQVENARAAQSCWNCQANLVNLGLEDIPTQRTKPRLLILRPASENRSSEAAPNRDVGAAVEEMATPFLPTVRLKVLRGLRISTEYPLYAGPNVIGRSDDRPVDIDLRDQEPGDRIWASRNHAVVVLADGELTVEDLKSTNGTYLNRHRLPPGAKRPLKADDVLQIGTVQLKVVG